MKKDRRHGNNYVKTEVRDVMIALIKEGASVRKICQFTGVAKNTAMRYIGIHEAEAPTCVHGGNIYKCLKCTSGRHAAHLGRSVAQSAQP